MNSSLLLIGLSAILWGTAGVSAKYLTSIYPLSSLTIGALRLLIASPVLLILSSFQSKEKTQINKKHFIYFILYGITAAAYQIAYFSSVNYIMVSIATLIALCTAPVFVAILSSVFLKEKITVKIFISLVISAIGTALIIRISSINISTDSHYLGYILALCAGFSYAVYAICGKKLVVHYTPVKVVSITFTLGALFILPFARIPNNLPWFAWIILLYLGIVTTAIAYIIFTIGLKKTSATKASIASLIEPLTSTALSLLVIGESFNNSQILGAILLFSALLIIAFKQR